MRLVALLLLASLAACARPGGPAPVIQGDRYDGRGATARTAPAVEETGRFVIVRRGDTLYSLAREHGVSLREMIDLNGVAPPFVIAPGQRLALPAPESYVVERGDTVYGISRRFGIDMRALVRANDIQPPYMLTVGQRLRLPGASQVQVADDSVTASARAAFAAVSPSGPAAAPVPNPTPAPVAVPRRSASLSPGPTTLSPPPPRQGERFLWPVRGRILVGFGPRGGGLHNDGINIAASEGTPVLAAEGGVVAYAGNQLQGFGNLLLIKHADGWLSAYAHNQTLLVGRGDVVKRGQVIARVGRTGNVSTPQLHFELRRAGRAVDPTSHLVRLAWLPGPRKVAVSPASFPAALPGPG
jgi:murein DD-endopeptidase MepM/ murein hydrolase activator NlpD